MSNETKTSKPLNLALNRKLLQFQRAVQVIKKESTNPHFKSKYADLPTILAEVKPIFNELELLLLQPTANGRAYTLIIDVATGEEISSHMMVNLQLTPQQQGSELTYLRRYMLAGMLSLEIDDDDANIAQAGAIANKEIKPWLNKGSAEFNKAKSYIEAGEPIIKIENKFRLSKEVRELLLKPKI